MPPAYLDLHPPAKTQFRCPRREDPSGVGVIHTAESVMDLVGPDTGAENVARYISTRQDFGSYHDLADADSALAVVRWECEAFHDATGSNRHSYGLSFACSYLDWAKMTKARRDAFVEQGAKRAAAWARWVHDTTGIVVPARRITRDQSEARVPGWLSHAERDPRRRKDPGNAPGQFPWDQFLTRYADLMGYAPSTLGDDDEMSAPCALWKFPGHSEVYSVDAAMTRAAHVPNSDALRFSKALLRLGGHGDKTHETGGPTSDDAKWLAGILKASGIPDPR